MLVPLHSAGCIYHTIYISGLGNSAVGRRGTQNKRSEINSLLLSSYRNDVR